MNFNETYEFLSDEIAKLRNILNRYHDERGFFNFDSYDFGNKYSKKELAEICGDLTPVLEQIIFDWEIMQKKEQEY